MFPANKFENILWVMAIAHVLHTWEPLRTCHNLCPPIITTMISSHGRTSMKADFAFVYFIHKFSVSCYSLLPPYLTFIHILDKQGSICTCRALLLSVFFLIEFPLVDFVFSVTQSQTLPVRVVVERVSY